MAKEPKNINFEPDEQMLAHLRLIIKKGGFGKSPTAAAQQLIWNAIRQLVSEGWIPNDPADDDK